MARLQEKKVLELIGRTMGNIAAIAKAFDMSRSSVHEFIHKRPVLVTALKDARETMTDNVESRFYSDCLKDDPAYQQSRKWYLATQGKDRGYVERKEVTGADGGPIRLGIIEEIVDATAANDDPAPPSPS